MRPIQPISKPWQAICIITAIICSQYQYVESGATIDLNMYGVTMYGCGFMGMPCDQYYTSINMGNGVAQQLKVTFDTCFNDLFVPLSGHGHQPLHYDSGFDPSRSTYYKEDSIQYGYTTLRGRWYSDYMSLFGNQWFAMTFMVAQTSTDNLAFEPWDGVLGLGPRQASRAGTSNLVTSLYQQNITNLLQFGLGFDQKNLRAQISLGGLDPNRAFNLQAFRPQNFANSDYWWIPLQPVTLNNQIIGCQTRSCQAIIHSGISDIYGPKSQVYELYYRLGIDYDRNRHTFVDCRSLSSNLELGFNFEGQPRYLLPQDYIRKFVDGANVQCFVAIYPTESADTWVLGTTFLSAYYTGVDIARNTVLMSKSRY